MAEMVSIGEASRTCGVKVPTIRYYEQIGLLPAAPRTEGNRRRFDAGDLRRLAFIRHARALGFEIDAIRTLLTLQDNPHQSCGTADAIARARLPLRQCSCGSLGRWPPEEAARSVGVRSGSVRIGVRLVNPAGRADDAHERVVQMETGLMQQERHGYGEL